MVGPKLKNFQTKIRDRNMKKFSTLRHGELDRDRDDTSRLKFLEGKLFRVSTPNTSHVCLFFFT